jgi:hypothetical protein
MQYLDLNFLKVPSGALFMQKTQVPGRTLVVADLSGTSSQHCSFSRLLISLIAEAIQLAQLSPFIALV